MNGEPQVGGSSPWGKIQVQYRLASGIVSVSTASHGGIWIDADHERRVPIGLRSIARQYAPAQWYEEDCDAAIIGVTFAEELTAEPKFVAAAREYFAKDDRFS